MRARAYFALTFAATLSACGQGSNTMLAPVGAGAALAPRTRALAVSRPLTLTSARDDQQAETSYDVFELPTFGGTYGNASGINNRSWVVGDANLNGDMNEHAALWRHGVLTDLGTLGGLNSGVGFPAQMGDRGLIAGNSQTSTTDPLGENWGLLFTCSPSGGSCQGYQNLVLGFRWQNGSMAALPTLGGNNAVALGGVNNRGQMVGYAENSTQDPTCAPPQVLDFEAVIWGPKKQQIRELPPFGGDAIGVAFGINETGQAVGTSGVCAFPTLAIARHALLWRNGSTHNLGSLGGMMTNIALAINNEGQVVGLSDLLGDATAHAFLWKHGVMTDLGTLSGDSFSIAQGINDAGQVVGQSCDASGNCRGFIWQRGVMTDLNTLAPPKSHLYLLAAEDINAQGTIVGEALDQSNGETLGFLAIPNDHRGHHQSAQLTLPKGIQEQFKQFKLRRI